MQNEAHYDLDRKAAKMSTLSSNNLGQYEYLTGEIKGQIKMIRKKGCLKGQKIFMIIIKSSYKQLNIKEENN